MPGWTTWVSCQFAWEEWPCACRSWSLRYRHAGLEVERPARIRPRFQKLRHPEANRLAAGASPAHGKPFLSIEPVYAVDP